MPDFRVVKNCCLFLPGHQTHWIQAKKGRHETSFRPLSCQLIDLSDDGSFLIELAGKRHHLWNHHPRGIALSLAKSHGIASYQRGWGLLKVGDFGLFNVARFTEDRIPCREAP